MTSCGAGSASSAWTRWSAWPPVPDSTCASKSGGLPPNSPILSEPSPAVRERGIAPGLCARLVQRAADDLPGKRVGQLAALIEHRAVDDDIIDADRLALYFDAAAGQRRRRLARLLRDRVGVEDRDVGDLAGGDKAAVGDVVHQRSLAGQPIDRLFERHRLLLAHPVTEQVGAGLVPVGGMRPAAAIAGADHRVRRPEDVLLHFWIMVAVDRLETGLQIVVERQVEEGVHDALVLLLGDLLDRLAFEVAVLALGGHEHLHEVPAPVEQAADATEPVGHAALLVDRALDRLGRQRLADFRVAEGLDPLAIGPR